MRIFVSIFLFLLFLTQSFSAYVLDGAYNLNKSYVAENLCVNKNKPQLHCNGKCYLSKQIAKDTKDSALPSGNKKDKDEVPYSLPPEAIFIPDKSAASKNLYSYHTAVSSPGYQSSPFQPPRSVYL